jgi:hypothetical protein
VSQINLQPIENLRKSIHGHSAVWVPKMQEVHKAADSQDYGQPSRRCGSDSMHQVRSHGGCTDRKFKCRSMSLNVHCAKSVLRWISQSMRNDTQSVADKTWVASTQLSAFHLRGQGGVINDYRAYGCAWGW